MLRSLFFSMSLKAFIISACLIMIPPGSYATETPEVMQQIEQRNVIQRGTEWMKKNPMLVLGGVVVLGATAGAYYFTSPAPLTVLDRPEPGTELDTIGSCRFYIPQEVLHTIATNVSTTVEGFTSKITGWILECWNPEIYETFAGWQTHQNFAQCMEWSMGDVFKYLGRSSNDAYTFVQCWAQNTTNILTCDKSIQGWILTNTELYLKSLGQRPLDNWYGNFPWDLEDMNFTHPTVGFHYAPKDIYLISYRPWECDSEAMPVIQ